MKEKEVYEAKMLYEAKVTWLPTIYPVYYFGLPDNTVNAVWTRPYSKPSGRKALEIVISRLDNYEYNYREEILYDLLSEKSDSPLMINNDLDKYDQKMTGIKLIKGQNMNPTKYAAKNYIEFVYREQIGKLKKEDIEFKKYCEKLEKQEIEEERLFEEELNKQAERPVDIKAVERNKRKSEKMLQKAKLLAKQSPISKIKFEKRKF